LLTSSRSKEKQSTVSLRGTSKPIFRFYQKDGFPIEDFKFWSGLGRKKFMGLNFVSMF